MNINYKIGDHLDVTVVKIVPNGLGLAFAEKLTVFVPLAATGDLLKVRLTQVKNKTAFAEIVEVIEASANRAAPPCQYYGYCGGCDFQHLVYEAQLAAKLDILKDSLGRIGKIVLNQDIEIVASPEQFGYRSRAKWQLATQEKKIGYFRRNSHDVIDVKNCPILVPELDGLLNTFRNHLNWANFWGDKANIEAAVSEGKTSVFSADVAEPTDEISFSVGGERFFYSAQSFFQGNQFLIEQLLEAAVGGASGETALDLYCGVGLFTLPLARKFAHVIGVEDNDHAIDFAERNVENARIENVSFIRDGVSDFLVGHELTDTDFVLLDPPRSGTEKSTIYKIAKLAPKEISYVSCEPSILARDLRLLLDHGYEIASIRAFDLFPQTHHVETVVRLKRI